MISRGLIGYLGHDGEDEVERELNEFVERIVSLHKTITAVRGVIIAQNSRVNLGLDHPQTELVVTAVGGSLSSKAVAYSRLLDIDEQAIADIQEEHLTVRVRGGKR